MFITVPCVQRITTSKGHGHVVIGHQSVLKRECGQSATSVVPHHCVMTEVITVMLMMIINIAAETFTAL